MHTLFVRNLLLSAFLAASAFGLLVPSIASGQSIPVGVLTQDGLDRLRGGPQW